MSLSKYLALILEQPPLVETVVVVVVVVAVLVVVVAGAVCALWYGWHIKGWS